MGELAVEITDRTRKSTTRYWRERVSVKTQLELLARQLLRRYCFPPGKHDAALRLVPEQ